MDIKKLEGVIASLGLPSYRIKQVAKAVFQDGVDSFEEISTLSKDLRQRLGQEIKILCFDVEQMLESADGDSANALVRLSDGHMIETVLISPKPGWWSACISSQVGCALGCRFCATGQLGFQRNLSAEEITDQVLLWQQFLKKNKGARLSNIVYMGMGEPFLNWENVRESLRNLISADLFGFGSRSISVSTAGIAEGIEKLASEFPQVNLALSLHFAQDEKRGQFMPINKKYPLAVLREALKKYFSLTNRKVFVEYILLDKVNDSAQDARELAKYINSIGKRQLLHVNLIRYNQTSGQCISSSQTNTSAFKNHLQKLGIQATIRKSVGQDIQGACGQLAGRKASKN